MKINLINKTHWRDDHIRAFLAKGMQAERPDLCKRGAPPMCVTVVYGHRNRHSGYAYYHSRTIRLRLPKENPDKVTFAKIIAHELAHTRGLKHDMMNSCATYGFVGRWRELYAWAEALPLEVKPKAVKQRPQVDAKLAHCNKMLALAFTREKRAVTLRKKWQSRSRYYERQLSKAAAKAPLA